MNLRLAPIFVALMLSLPSPPGVASDANAGEQLADRACKTCHGGTGRAPERDPDIPTPNLAAQRESYLVNQLKAFRDGSRADPLMSAIATTLSDEDIANLAAFYFLAIGGELSLTLFKIDARASPGQTIIVGWVYSATTIRGIPSNRNHSINLNAFLEN